MTNPNIPTVEELIDRLFRVPLTVEFLKPDPQVDSAAFVEDVVVVVAVEQKVVVIDHNTFTGNEWGILKFDAAP